MNLIIKRIPLLAFCLYLIKISIMGTYISEVCTLAILTTMACYFEHKVNWKEILRLDNSLKEQKEITNQINKELREVKLHVAGIKMSYGMRSPNVNKTG